jgi:hypothetical protein
MTSSSSFAALDQCVAALENRIQTAIAQTTPKAPPVIRCRFQQGRLLVLSEDDETAITVDERDARFKALAVAMTTSLTEIELPDVLLNDNDELPVRLYLRKRGTASPYAARNWGWRPADAVTDLFEQAAFDTAGIVPEDEGEGAAGALVLLSRETHDDADLEAFAPIVRTAQEAPPFWHDWRQMVSPTSWHAIWQRLSQDWQALPWRSVGGLAVAGLTVGAIAYTISRPCAFGNCERRQTASDLSQATLDQLQGRPTPQEITGAYQDLQKAVRLMAAIPPWSPHYDAAQAELFRYRSQLSDLEWIIAAQKNATEASEKSQNPPHPVPLWVDVHLLWQKAVNHLNRVPDESPFEDFVVQKRQEYEANYETIGQRLQVEEAAEANLSEAMAAGQLAQVNGENAATLTDWLAVQREWDRAIQAISRIPQGTLAYDEARSLLTDYRSQSVQTRTRVTFENAGERAFQEALADAAQAQAAERDQQWTQAVNFWNDAFAQMRQVPKNTIRYAEAQTLLSTYQTSLKQAQTNLRQAVALQSIEDDLAELCPPVQGICTYRYGSQQIELMLREPYDSAIRQSISPPSTQGRLSRNDAVIEDTHQLVQKIMQLGNQVQLSIWVYDENRQFIARYRPDYGGFVKN